MYSQRGFCPCCDQAVTFQSESDWFRDHLLCQNCGSVVRERALALILGEVAPDWRKLRIHESSPADRGISKKLRQQAPRYLASYYFPEGSRGEFVGRFRNEDLENQTFENETFDLVISLDVMEHVFEPAKVYQEVFRTLRPGGRYLHTFPIRKLQDKAIVQRAARLPDGTITHLIEPPEYHGNPLDDLGSLVTIDYGYDIGRQIAAWAPFDVRILRFWDTHHGVIGEYTEVIDCRKVAGEGRLRGLKPEP